MESDITLRKQTMYDRPEHSVVNMVKRLSCRKCGTWIEECERREPSESNEIECLSLGTCPASLGC